MFDYKNKVKAVLDGKLRIRRFNDSEQSGSSLPADGFLWRCLLQAESELADCNGGAVSSGAISHDTGKISPYRFLNDVSSELPDSFDELLLNLGHYEDRGRESIVFDSGDGYVRKLRLMNPSIHSGYIAPLAGIIYHNRIFRRDRYVLENILHREGRYFMLLRQKRIDIMLDGNGYPIRPTATQIRTAIQGLDVRFYEYCGGQVEEEEDSTESTESDQSVGEHLRFYNEDYYLSDIQPGRNTVIDAASGEIHFIDPRIILNDPNGPITHVSRFGKRRESFPGQRF